MLPVILAASGMLAFLAVVAIATSDPARVDAALARIDERISRFFRRFRPSPAKYLGGRHRAKAS